jgi:hypothetical protein
MNAEEHHPGRLGVGGSNPLAPTIQPTDSPHFRKSDSDAIPTRGPYPVPSSSAAGFLLPQIRDGAGETLGNADEDLRLGARRIGVGAWPLLLEEPDDDQQDHRADHGVDDRGEHAADQHKSDHRQQPAGNDGADNADHDVADQPEAVTLDDQAGEPARDRTDDKPDDERFDHDHLPQDETPRHARLPEPERQAFNSPVGRPPQVALPSAGITLSTDTLLRDATLHR